MHTGFQKKMDEGLLARPKRPNDVEVSTEAKRSRESVPSPAAPVLKFDVEQMKRNLEEQRKKMADKLQQLTSNSKPSPAASPSIKAPAPQASGVATTSGVVTTPAPFNIAALQASVKVNLTTFYRGDLVVVFISCSLFKVSFLSSYINIYSCAFYNIFSSCRLVWIL